jgi:acyl-CoA thioester hydrolase
MQIVWHGNYVKYMEKARCALLDKIGFGYLEMAASGYGWPVVDIRLKYVRPLVFHQKARITATLLEYENRLRIAYVIRSGDGDGPVANKAESTQMAVDAATGESCFVSPRCLVERVEAYLAKGEPIRA